MCMSEFYLLQKHSYNQIIFMKLYTSEVFDNDMLRKH